MRIINNIFIKCSVCGCETLMTSTNQKRCKKCSDDIRKSEGRKGVVPPKLYVVNFRKQSQTKCSSCDGEIENPSPWRKLCSVCKDKKDRLSEKLRKIKVKDRTAIRFNAYKREKTALNPKFFSCEGCGKIERKDGAQKYCRECAHFAIGRSAKKRYLAKRNVQGTHTRGDFFRLCIELDWKCTYCGIILDKKTATEDHIIPISRNGSDDISNITLSCTICNCQKHTKNYFDFITQKRIAA